MNIRDKFLSVGIPFDELDKEMIPILEVLNFNLNVKTKFCCYGHTPNEKTYIMFDDQVEDKQIEKVVEAVSNLNEQRTMVFKWMRKTWEDKVISNWILEIKNSQRYGNKEEYHLGVISKLKAVADKI